MNAPDPNLQTDLHIGRYERSTGTSTEWWNVTVSDRPQMYRIEHGRGDDPANIDTVVDLENLKSKLQKWHREGFCRPGDAALIASKMAGGAGFIEELRRTAALAADRALTAPTENSAIIGTVHIPTGQADDAIPR
jgi:cobaltochelatase CobS